MLPKKILFKIITLCPFLSIRLWIYKNLFHYSIGKNTYIGRSIINAKKVTIGANVRIVHHISITCNQLDIGDGTSILSGTVIQGDGSFTIGKNSRIINDHYIDLGNDVRIGNNTWLAGKQSQIWTHGSLHTKTGEKDLRVVIGDDIYIGSNTLIAPGVHIAHLNLIGMGSVVTKSIETSRNVVAGNPATIVKQDIDWRENW
jgi:acetyltransferase-like isoleucine patch superfamily enzyme